MGGRLFALVGPSGAGKDTLLAAASAARPDLVIVQRVITRPESAGGEPFEGVTPAEFARRNAAGLFALHWQAHGLCYGVPVGIHADLDAGHDVIFNGSRGMLTEACRQFPDLRVILVTAPVPVLAARLAARGRETAQDIAARLERAGFALPEGLNISQIDNSGVLEDAVAMFLAALQPQPDSA